MLSESYVPSPSLRHVAKCYHIRHFVFSDTTKSFKPYPARPEQSIVFFPRQREIVEHLDSEKKLVRPKAMIMNQYTMRTNRHIENDFLVIIIELQPGILCRLSGMDLHQSTNTDFDAASVLSVELSHTEERLHSTDDYQTMITIIERLLVYLSQKLKSPEHAVDKVAQFILNGNYNAPVDWLANHACLSSRQLERKFRQRMGVGPKTFARLARMHETYKLKSTSPQTDWLDIAVRHGYHDYQHLVKDYQEFAGCAPTELFHQQMAAPEKLFGLSETF